MGGQGWRSTTICANLIYDDGGSGDGGFTRLSKTALARRSIPAVFLDHVGELDDVLALLVLLAGLEGVLIFPPKGRFTAFAVDVGYRMETSQQDAFFGLATSDVDHRVEEVRPALASLERFRY